MLPAHILFIEGELFGIIVFTIGGVIWTLVPFLDRKAGNQKASYMMAFGWLVLAFIVAMTALGYILE